LVEFLDSTGEGVLIGALKRARARGHDRPFALVVPDERIKKGFRIHGTTKVFAMFDDISAAIAYMSDDPVQIDAALEHAVDSEEVGWQWFPARIYTSDTDAGMTVEECLAPLADAFGMEVVYEFPVEYGSFFREYRVRMKDSTALPTRDEMLSLMRRAAEQQTLDMPQAKIDVTQSVAVANILAALDKTPSAVVQFGSMLIVKARDTTIVRTLTQLEIAHWERNPGLFQNPETALLELQRASDSFSAAGDPQ
jgi:hypothetical protein